MPQRHSTNSLTFHTKRGQTLIIFALMAVVLFGFAGLALDAAHLYLVHRNARNAVDASALAAGKRLVGLQQTGPPTAGSNASSLKAAHDLAASNGFSTVLSTTCDTTVSGTPNRFSTSWFDANGGTCSAPSGYTTRVDVYVPPRNLVSSCTAQYYNCIEVVITQQVTNYLMGVLGQPVSTVSVSASSYGDPAGFVASVPPAIALYLYEPGQSACSGSLQCFSPTWAPQRSMLDCTGGPKSTANCPTFWVLPGSNPLIKGINGNILQTPTDMVAMQSNGDMVLQDVTGTTICDPWGGASCSAGAATGSKGFAINTSGGSKLYCSGSTPAALSPVACTTTGPGTPPAALGPIYGNEVSFAAQSWSPTVDTSGLPSCGGLILNGESVASHALPGTCAPSPSAPYTVQPGQYTYIVINHGFYVFGTGVYYITGNAPVNNLTLGTANGIDHSRETAATDWDLCAAGVVTGCPSLTAGVWFGRGTMGNSPFVAPVTGSCGVSTPTDGGGGDLTAIIGEGVSFVLGSSAGGFVSTNEVSYISLDGPGIGAQPRTSGAPLLVYLQSGNNNFVHLDAQGSLLPSAFKGLIYQPNTAKAGGVEVNPGLGAGSPALAGQILAYSFTTFGTGGIALDFSQGYGGSLSVATPSDAEGDDDNSGFTLSGSGGSSEPQIVTGAYVQAAPGKPGYEQLVMNYADEWKLDAYSAYITINSRPPVFFSQGIWSPAPPLGTPLPPATNNPGDSNPADPLATQDVNNAYTITTTGGKPDWTMNYPNKTTPTSWFEVVGDWSWGHQQQIAGASTNNYTATLIYTFPIPAGQTVTISMFMTDGDRCGDFATSTWTFNNVGQPNGGQQVTGTVHLVQ